jgi:hypothetical protein
VTAAELARETSSQAQRLQRRQMSVQEEMPLGLQLEVEPDLVAVARLVLLLALVHDRLCLPLVALHHEEDPSKARLQTALLLFLHAHCHQHHHLHLHLHLRLLFLHEI